MNGTLILFARYPESGLVKTRLAGFLGADGATALHRVMVEHTMATVRRSARDLNLRLEIHHTGPTDAMSAWLGADACYRAQTEGDLGVRMAMALDTALPPVILVGTDCPDLSSDVLTDALAVLRNREVVLGPAADGGYYLVGMKCRRPDIFNDIPWGSDQVLARTRDRLRRSGVTWGETRMLADIDRPADLIHLPAQLRPPGP